MYSELKQRIESDLCINKFKLESEEQYNQRLIYSVLAMWAKTFVYGQPINSKENELGYIDTHILYIQSNLKRIIRAYIDIFPINITWLNKDDKDLDESISNLASYIINELKYTYNIASLGEGRVTLPPSKNIFYSGEYEQVFGSILHNREMISVGVSQWNKKLDNKDIDKWIINLSANEYIKFMNKTFRWKEKELKLNYFIFAPGKRKAYSKCWRELKEKNIPQGISIVKSADKFEEGYALIKKDNNSIKISELDPWYKENKEIYRILLALNYNNKTPAQFNVKNYEDYKILYMNTAIPSYENRIIISCSWPYGVYDNKYIRIIPNELWDIVQHKLSFLGIDLIEQ